MGEESSSSTPRPQDGGQIQLDVPHPLQRIGNALALGPQLFLVAHVAELAAAAFAEEGAVGLEAHGGGEQQLHPTAPGHVFVHLLQPDPPPLPLDGVRDKDHPPLQPGHPHPLGGVAGDVQGVDGVFSDICHGAFPL